MREWALYLFSGAVSAFGAVVAASGCEMQGTFFGCWVLVFIFSLWWANMHLEEAA